MCYFKMFLNVNDQDPFGNGESPVLWPKDKSGISPIVFCSERELLLLASHVTSDLTPEMFNYSSARPCYSELEQEILLGNCSAFIVWKNDGNWHNIKKALVPLISKYLWAIPPLDPYCGRALWHKFQEWRHLRSTTSISKEKNALKKLYNLGSLIFQLTNFYW